MEAHTQALFKVAMHFLTEVNSRLEGEDETYRAT